MAVAERLLLAVRGRLLKALNGRFGLGPCSRIKLSLLLAAHPYCEPGLSEQVALAHAMLCQRQEGSHGDAFVSGTGCLVIPLCEQIIQVPLSSHAIENTLLAFAARESILRYADASTAALVDYHAFLHQAEGISVWAEFERLKPIAASAQMSTANEVLQILARKSISGPTPRWLLQAWKECVAKSEGAINEGWLQWITSAVGLGWRVGPTHFDLTPSNMLYSRHGPALIDLARFRMDGIQAFDVMHFVIERRAKCLGRSWIELILEVIKPSGNNSALLAEFSDAGVVPSADVLRAYFLTRVWFDGQGEGWKTEWLRKISPLADKLLLSDQVLVRA